MIQRERKRETLPAIEKLIKEKANLQKVAPFPSDEYRCDIIKQVCLILRLLKQLSDAKFVLHASFTEKAIPECLVNSVGNAIWQTK